jgi:flagellin
MRELAVQAASGTYNDSDRVAMDLEFGELWTEIQRIATQTTWNTMTVLNGDDVTNAGVANTNITIQLGKSSSQTMSLSLRSWDPRTTVKATTVLKTGAVAFAEGAGAVVGSPTATGVLANGNDNHRAKTAGTQPAYETETQAYGGAVLYVGNNGGTAGRINILFSENATHALTNLDLAITAASAERARYGSYIGRLQAAANNLTNVAQNQDQSRSRIEDTDYAVETSELSRTQIIAQASTAMLAQANQSKQTVLALLQ